jgi:hypothetical protein
MYNIFFPYIRHRSMIAYIQQAVYLTLVESDNRPIVDQGNRNPLLAASSFHILGSTLIAGHIHFLEADIMFSEILLNSPAP